MSLTKKPVTGMKDILPEEMRIRDYCISVIEKTYESFGFSHIETPGVEHIENLCSNQGGENEKLIFKVMKRGEKLNLEEAKSENDLADSGLRYDLTLPLSRFYANNQATLPSPFKALQMGNVWRADRPQKGRFRQFMQCDIDILGEESNLAEIELVLATTTLLSKLGFSNFKVKINERRILKAMAAYAGFDEEKIDLVFVILDKMDKIGFDGVKEDLIANGFEAATVEKYMALFDEMGKNTDASSVANIDFLKEKLGDLLDESVTENLKEIFASVNAAKTADFNLAFDPTLVRGMGYYTGTIFEIEMSELNCAVAGGGRYDKMIGKFTGNDTPACGFSIGFERIITIMLDKGFKIPGESEKIAFLVEKNIKGERMGEIIKEAAALRNEGKVVLIAKMNKNKKFQKETLEKQGFTEFKSFYAEELKH
ncbi:histidyl-tRNA synthetase [Lachnospiraceae bacterium G41]|nr:histidyl-tRNA synthetase [Lachnospiraceae bacterium G41]